MSAAEFLAIVLIMFIGTEALTAIEARDLARNEAKWWFDRYIAESKQLHRIVMALAEEPRARTTPGGTGEKEAK